MGTPIASLSTARIVGELALAGATATSTTYAVKYSGEVKGMEEDKRKVKTKEEDVAEKEKNFTTLKELPDLIKNWWDCHNDSSKKKEDCKTMAEAAHKKAEEITE